MGGVHLSGSLGWLSSGRHGRRTDGAQRGGEGGDRTGGGLLLVGERGRRRVRDVVVRLGQGVELRRVEGGVGGHWATGLEGWVGRREGRTSGLSRVERVQQLPRRTHWELHCLLLLLMLVLLVLVASGAGE